MPLLEYTTEDVVRDYECDLQGIVNNAEYMHYCEHARNQSIVSLGHTLESLYKKQEMPVVAKAEMNFKHSLRSGDTYRVDTRVEAKGSVRLLFYQHIYDGQGTLCVEACFTIAILSQGNLVPIKKSIFANLIDGDL